jgi:hypothetical protein
MYQQSIGFLEAADGQTNMCLEGIGKLSQFYHFRKKKFLILLDSYPVIDR